MFVCVCVCEGEGRGDFYILYIYCQLNTCFFFFFLCIGACIRALADVTCTLRTSSEFCKVSSSICVCSSATVPGSAGAGEGLAESVSSP